MNKRESFLKDVIHEIGMLKQHATPEEIDNLSIENFNPRTPSGCIYGQLSGDCASQRAKSLMDVSCIRVMDLDCEGVDGILHKDIEDEEFNINGKYEAQTWNDQSSWSGRTFRYLSALEGYICTKDAKNKEIIQYLKGEIPTLIL